MNTMYRNELNGYENVKNEFCVNGSEILMDGRNLQTELSAELKSSHNETELQVKTELERLKTDVNKSITGEMLFCNVKKSQNKEYQTLLNKFNKMPKGGLLHVHSTVGLDADSLLKMIADWNTRKKDNDMKIFYLETELKLVIDGEEKTIPEKTLMFKKQFDAIEKEKDIKEVTTEDIENIKSFISFDRQKDWTEFNNIFCRTKALFECKEFYGIYHEKFFEECIKNNISYVEIRTGFQGFSVSGEKSITNEEVKKGIIFLRPDFMAADFFYHENMLTDTNPAELDIEFLKQIKLARNSVRRKKEYQDADKFEVKVILTANRNTKTEEAFKNVLKKIDAAIAIKNIYNDVKKESDIPDIAGFDLVSEERPDIGITDSFSKCFYSNFGSGYEMSSVKDENLKMFILLKSKQRSKLIRFFLHDGESMGTIEDNKDNAITGPICSRHRIGHGFKMGIKDINFNNPTDPKNRKKGTLIADYILSGCSEDVGQIDHYPIELLKVNYLRKDKIAEPVIEFCPISNQLLGYTENLNMHPAGNLIKKGIFAVVSNDDPQIFDNPGLSYDYLMAFISGILDYDQIKISVFLGYFYREMSNCYYTKPGNIWVVNDDMTFTDEIEIISSAIKKFKTDWDNFLYNFSIG